MPTRRALLAAGLAAGCASRPAPVSPARGPATGTIFAVQRDWHTDIGVMVGDLHGPLAPLAADWPGARSLVIGFGERAYLMSRNRALADMAMALLPGPGALLVTGLSVRPDEAFPEVVPLGVDDDGMARLQRALAASFERDEAGTPRQLREGPYRGAAYYGATLRYSAAFTCNTWTAELLREAGLPIQVTGVIFAGQVMEQVRRVATAEASSAAPDAQGS